MKGSECEIPLQIKNEIPRMGLFHETHFEFMIDHAIG